MPNKTPKAKLVAFKVEEELADFLNKLPNKSAFIRKAIAAQMSMACPLCSGTGQVSRWAHDHYAPLLASWVSKACDGCGGAMSLPRDPGELSAEDQTRLEQFFHGGPLYCDPCYDKAPSCTDCGWHIAKGHEKEHKKHAHHPH
jgi:hypothetical protein